MSLFLTSDQTESQRRVVQQPIDNEDDPNQLRRTQGTNYDGSRDRVTSTYGSCKCNGADDFFGL